ncbi:hypothetical protein [Nocardia sp. NRRL WC-3656]|uniref:WXG100-like domain-containing protein n=1 Tax=Nocardia sp. NRRL WC-3656 TaxID=1463824 RepID=UPI000ABDE480|nr:hypothetical protein [Nocardia sp. NRRL WC-3656]
MAIEIPHDVALFLNYAGVPYPDINEDQVRALGTHVRNFANGVADTHDTATGVITDMRNVYSGYSYQALVAAWARMSKSHMADLDAVCRVVADALDAAAVVIKVTKVAVLAELAALAASYTAAIAATIVTDGLSVAIEQAIAAAARKICQVMEQALLGYILVEVVGKAIEPLEHVIDRMVRRIVDDIAGELLGPPPGSADQPLYIEPDEVINYSRVLDGLADDILQQASDFADKAAGLDFTTPTSDDGGGGGPAVGPGTDPLAGVGSQTVTNDHAPALVADTSPTAPPSVQLPAYILSEDSLSSSHPPDHSGTHMSGEAAEATGRPAHHAAGWLPGSYAASNTRITGVQPNPDIGGAISGAGSGHVAAGPDDAASSPGHVVAGTGSDGLPARADSSVTAQHNPDGTPARYAPHSPVFDPQPSWNAALSSPLSSAMGQDRVGRPLEQAADADDQSSPSQSNPGGRPSPRSNQRVTPWRKRDRNKAVPEKSPHKTASAAGTPWSGRGVPSKSEPTLSARPDTRPMRWRTDQPEETADTADEAQTLDSERSSAQASEKETASATRQPESAPDHRGLTVVAPSVAADNRPEPNAETLPRSS